jgi:4-hydroxybenzoate polyprenyltransferase
MKSLNKYLNKTADFFSLVKFSHTIFAMPFALVGFFYAISVDTQQFSWLLFVKMILCMIFARNAAMAFNRYLDKDIDADNPRTKNREIPAGKINPATVLFFTIINVILFISTTFFINKLVFYLSPIAIGVILFYSYTKRFTALCHVVLGLGLSLAPIGAYLTVIPEFDLVPILLSFAVLLWTAGFDIIYSLQDEDFDKSLKLYSLPSRLGKKTALAISALMHLITIILLFSIYVLNKSNVFFLLAVIIFSILLFNQHRIVYKYGMAKINIAFLTNNGIAGILFAIFSILSFFTN